MRCSARKVKPVADLVRGKDVNEALAILKFTPRKSARILYKVMQSAVANAENNFDMDAENLFVSEVYANQGPTMKRFKRVQWVEQILLSTEHRTLALLWQRRNKEG